MRRFLIAIALATVAAAQPTTPINNPRLTGTGLVTGTLAPSGAGVITASVQQTLDLLSTTRGTIIYRGASGWAALAPGTADYVLATGGPGADPYWVVQGGGVPGSGTVTSIPDGSTNGVTWTVATRTTTPTFTFTLGAITPTTVNGVIFVAGTGTPQLTVNGTSSISGANTGDQTNITGNAATATALQTARTINGVSFDGTANITVTAAAGTLSGTTLASGVTASSLLSAAGGTFGTAAFTAASAYEPALGNPSVTGYVLSSTTAGVRSWVAQSGGGGTPGGSDTQVQFNDGGSFGGDAGLVFNKTTDALTVAGAITGSNLSGTNTGDQTNITGNAATATALQTARTINGVNFDGTSNITVTAAGSTLSDTVPITKGGTGEVAAGPAFDALTVQGSDVASGTTTNIGAGTGVYLNITGTTQIDAFDTAAAGRVRILRFAGALQLTHNGTSLILPGAANITTAAGDTGTFVSLGSGNWRCVAFQRAASPPVSGTNTGDQTNISGNAATATAFQTARTINGVSFDGTANITLTTADIADSSNKRYVTDAQLTLLGNTSGTNTGDQNIFASIVVAGQTTVTTASTTQALTLVEGSNITITTNNTTKEITIAASGGGGTPGGSDTQVQFNDGGAFGGDAGMTYDKTTDTLTVGKLNGLTVTSSTGTLTVTNGKTASFSNSITFAGTDSTTQTFPSTSQTIVGLTATQQITSKQILDSGALGTDDTWEGTAITGLNAGATIVQWEAVYLGASSKWLKADANDTGTYPARGIAVAAYIDTDPAIVITRGTVRNDAWTWTVGGTIYLSTTAGGLTQTAPSTSGDKIQQIGFALTADIAYFDFASGEYLTVQ